MSAAASSTAAAADRHHVTIFGIFNYKGGVGKSTNAINIAAALSHLDKKVLVVDADPQCNTTTFYLSADSETLRTQEAAQQPAVIEDGNAEYKYSSDDDGSPSEFLPAVIETWPTDSAYAGNPKLPAVPGDRLNPKAKKLTFDQISNFSTEYNLYTLLRPIFMGDRVRVLSQQHLMNHIDCINASYQKRVYLIAGSVRADRFERDLDVEEADSQYMYKMGAFRWCLRLAANHIKADIVLVDFGPSGGLVNKVFALSCDALIPPSFSEYFSVSSADALLTSVLPAWLEWRDKLVLYQRNFFRTCEPHWRSEANKYHFNRHEPRILPFLVTSYSAKEGQIDDKPSAWLLLLDQLVEGKVTFAHGQPQEIHVRRDAAFARVQKLFVPFGESMTMKLFDDAGSLIQISHQLRKPIYDLERADLKRVNLNWDSYPPKLERYRRRYKLYAQNLILLAGWLATRNRTEAPIDDAEPSAAGMQQPHGVQQGAAVPRAAGAHMQQGVAMHQSHVRPRSEDAKDNDGDEEEKSSSQRQRLG